MFRGLVSGVAGAALSLIVLAQQAQAQMMAPVTMNYGRAYVGGTVGVIIPESLHISASGAVVGSSDLTFNAGPAFSGLIGYHLNEYLAVEGELGYASFDEDSFAGASVDGHLNTVFGFGNLIVTPWGRSGFSPYIGGGIGFTNFDETVNTIGGVPVNSSASETDFAANFIAGFQMPVAYRWSVGARYRFVWVNASSTTTNGAVSISQGDFTAHVITANATFHF